MGKKERLRSKIDFTDWPNLSAKFSMKEFQAPFGRSPAPRGAPRGALRARRRGRVLPMDLIKGAKAPGAKPKNEPGQRRPTGKKDRCPAGKVLRAR